MNTKAIIASTFLTTLFAGQSAIAGQNIDGGYFEAESASNHSTMMEKSMQKVNYSTASESSISAELDAELFPQGEGQ